MEAARRARHYRLGDLGPETDYGRYTLPYDAVRVLATQAYVGRRKDQYRNEFVLALKILGEGVVTRKELRSSWGGAVGLTQFLRLNTTNTKSISTATAALISGTRCRTRWPRPLRNWSTRAGSRICAGRMK